MPFRLYNILLFALFISFYLSIFPNFSFAQIVSQTNDPNFFIPINKYGVFSLAHDQRTGITYIGGNFTRVGGTSTGAAALFNLSTGQATTSFPKIQGTVYTIISDGNGGYYIGGSFNKVNNLNIKNLVHILPDYTVDQSFRPDPNNIVYALEKVGTTLYIGGVFDKIYDQTRRSFAVINLNNNQLLNSSYNFYFSVKTIKANSSTVFVGGDFKILDNSDPSQILRKNIAAFDLSGGLLDWQAPEITSTLTFQGLNLSPSVETIALSSSTVYIGGLFNKVADQDRNFFAAFDINTGQLLPLSINFDSNVFSISLTDNRIYVGGSFERVNGQTRYNIAAFDYQGNLSEWNPSVSYTVRSIVATSSRVYIGGDFNKVLNQDRDNFALIDENGNLLNLSLNPNGQVFTILINEDKLLLGGEFNSLNGQKRTALFAVDNNGNILNWDPQISYSGTEIAWVNSLYLTDKVLYVGGNFNRIGLATRTNLAAFDVSTGLPGNLISWAPNPNNEIRVIRGSSDSLYVSGYFNQIDGQNINRFAVFQINNNGLPGTLKNINLNLSSTSTILDIAVSPSLIFLAGNFSYNDKRNLMAIDQNGNLTSWNPSPDNSVNSLFISSSTLYVGGSFLSISGQDRKNLAAFDINSLSLLSWPNINLYSPYVPQIKSLITIGPYIYLGGHFTQVLSQPRNYIAAIDLNGNLLSWNPSFNGPVYAMALSTSSLYVGGNFYQIGSNPIYNLARFTLKNPPTITTSKNNFTLDIPEASTTLSIQTDKASNCRLDIYPNKDFSDMRYSFTPDSSYKNHTYSITSIEYGTIIKYYIKCQDRSDNENKNFEDFIITFSRGTTFKDIGPTGGSLQSIDNSNAIVSVSQSVLYTTSTFQIKPIIETSQFPSLPTNRKYANLVYNNYNIFAYDIKSNISSFQNPINLSIKYDSSKIVDNYVDVFKLVNNSWTAQNASCSNGVCNLTTRSLSIYAVLTKQSPDTNQNQQGSTGGGGGGSFTGGGQITQQQQTQQTPKQQNTDQLLISYLLNLLASKPTTSTQTPIVKTQKINIPSYCKFNKVLKYGDTDSKIMKKYKNDKDKPVSCLQIFLKSQGKDIYPEGQVTGRFGPATRKAVMRFQEKYKEDILIPQKLKKPTGKVAGATLKKIREIINLSK